LIKQDFDLFLKWINKTTLSNDWILNWTKDKKTFELIAKMIIEYSRYFKIESEKYNCKLINLDKKFEEKIDYIVKSF